MGVCVFIYSRELWHAVWPPTGGGDSSRGQAPWCGGAVCVQHDGTGDRWDQLCHSTGTQSFDLLCTGAASHTPQTHIKLNYCSLFSRGTVYAQLRFLCLRSVFLKLSHTDYEMCFCCPALTFPVLLLSGLPYWVYLVREILDIRELMGLLWTNKGQDTKRTSCLLENARSGLPVCH